MFLNEARLSAVVTEAFEKTSNNRRWQTAVVCAKVELETNPFIAWNGKALIILSPSNELYEANGTCQCAAFKSHNPCWHRAAARLIERYNEAVH